MLELVPSEQLAYVVHDIHNDSHKEGGKYPDAGKTPGNAEYIARHVRLLEAARSAGLEVFFTGPFLTCRSVMIWFALSVEHFRRVLTTLSGACHPQRQQLKYPSDSLYPKWYLSTSWQKGQCV